MAKEKDSKKVAFYKRNRKDNPNLTNEDLRKMWMSKKESETKTTPPPTT